ncbi:uncharacterized protein MCYG_06995 [Microsporum canis CBS 113480]|uniref:Uncharacterized protein n=1 Tax=Arthroderma otae (strain ATCC MYA-4605 / CBS 113480) TaxID=554155 RepID=C5FW92_ARTOC|nr:uncharacterized protein MCYG_06995 [Microsporum canis CBS 113480]EEQ34176.1 predicted protein [Microsporum canis CBS 113480]
MLCLVPHKHMIKEPILLCSLLRFAYLAHVNYPPGMRIAMKPNTKLSQIPDCGGLSLRSQQFLKAPSHLGNYTGRHEHLAMYWFDLTPVLFGVSPGEMDSTWRMMISAFVYEPTMVANRRLSPWSSCAVLVLGPGYIKLKTEPPLTLNCSTTPNQGYMQILWHMCRPPADHSEQRWSGF